MTKTDRDRLEMIRIDNKKWLRYKAVKARLWDTTFLLRMIDELMKKK